MSLAPIVKFWFEVVNIEVTLRGPHTSSRLACLSITSRYQICHKKFKMSITTIRIVDAFWGGYADSVGVANLIVSTVAIHRALWLRLIIAEAQLPPALSHTAVRWPRDDVVHAQGRRDLLPSLDIDAIDENLVVRRLQIPYRAWSYICILNNCDWTLLIVSMWFWKVPSLFKESINVE